MAAALKLDQNKSYNKPLTRLARRNGIFGLVPQRNQFKSDEVYREIMRKYVRLLKRKESLRLLQECMNKNMGK